MSSILKLKNKEFNKNPECSCRGFCFIDHKKYNFHKCEAEEIFKKIEQLSNDSKINICSQNVPNSSLLLKCDDCEETFPNKKNRKSHMKKHNKKLNLNTDKKVKETMKIKPVKKKKNALKAVKLNIKKKVEQVEPDDDISSDNCRDFDVSSSDDDTENKESDDDTENTESQFSSEVESGEVYQDSEDSS